MFLKNFNNLLCDSAATLDDAPSSNIDKKSS